MSSNEVINYRRKRKKDLVEICGGKCLLCGYNKCTHALQFHHLDPLTKKYGLSNGNCHSLESDLEEIKKCILVCSNCHAEIHNGDYSLEELKSK